MRFALFSLALLSTFAFVTAGPPVGSLTVDDPPPYYKYDPPTGNDPPSDYFKAQHYHEKWARHHKSIYYIHERYYNDTKEALPKHMDKPVEVEELTNLLHDHGQLAKKHRILAGIHKRKGRQAQQMQRFTSVLGGAHVRERKGGHIPSLPPDDEENHPGTPPPSPGSMERTGQNDQSKKKIVHGQLIVGG